MTMLHTTGIADANCVVRLYCFFFIDRYGHDYCAVNIVQRIADSVDADIKRWAAGKEGNLRALLSSMQYVRTFFVSL